MDNQCDVFEFNVPHTTCSDYNIKRMVDRVMVYRNGNAYDQDMNYLGQWTLTDHTLHINPCEKEKPNE